MSSRCVVNSTNIKSVECSYVWTDTVSIFVDDLTVFKSLNSHDIVFILTTGVTNDPRFPKFPLSKNLHTYMAFHFINPYKP